MPKYRCTLADGRTIDVNSDSETGARAHVPQAEMDRVVIEARGGRNRPVPPSEVVSIERIK